MSARFGSRLKFVWINDPGELLFALKDAAASPAAIAMQCDRVEYAARTEPFYFLGGHRLFPFTIYHLALIFGRPVLFAVGVPDGPQRAILHASPRFDIIPGESREHALTRAREHFQCFLRLVEGLLRTNPYLWFNFTPLNPVAKESADDPLRVAPATGRLR
jgi:predicted LPLAT superfamily acyltransferase